MADFRRWILAVAVIALVFTGLASAQTTSMNCIAFSNPSNLRTEGYTEQIGDITITCTGGSTQNDTAGPGGTIPTANITVYLNGTVTSRLFNAGSTVVNGTPSEALLFIDEPQSGEIAPVAGFGPQAAQIPCGTANNGTLTAVAVGAVPGGCPAYYQDSGTYNGLAATGIPVAVNAANGTKLGGATPAANVYQGVVTGQQVTFFGIPILPPVSANVNRVYRITNIRVNANQIGVTGSGLGLGNVFAQVGASGAGGFTVQNNNLTVGFIQNSLTTSLRRSDNGGSLSASNSLNWAQCLAQNPYSLTISSTGAPIIQSVLRFQENFATAFKTRVAGPIGGGQNALFPQATPGAIYNSESGFIYNYLSYGTYVAGLADYGTRLKATFNNVPAGVSLWVTTNNYASGNTVSQVANGTASLAQLIIGETASENNTTVPVVPATTTTGGGIALLPVASATATAVWEVVNTLPNQNEILDFGLYVGYVPNPANNVPSVGAMTVTLSYAPTPTVPFSATTGAAASASLSIPRFAQTGTATNALVISICQTAILFPYVVNVGGYDTGLAIANTSVDPFGTAAQSGICAINWYQGATNPAPGTLGAGGYGTSTPIAAGTIQSWLVSSTQAGFNGYVIAVCNFQYAHGFAFVSDLGARNLAMGYLGLILNTRGPAAESLAH